MEYAPPFDYVGGDDSYSNGGGAVEGSAVPAEAVEPPQREIVNAITAAGLTPSAADETQLAQAIAIAPQTKALVLATNTNLGDTHREKILLCVNIITASLPNAAATPVGWATRVLNFNTGGQVVTVNTLGGSLVLRGAVVSSLKLYERADSMWVVCDGANWQVLQWSGVPAFSAWPSANFAIPSDTPTKIPANLTEKNVGIEYNTTLHRFTPGVPGWYEFRIQARLSTEVPVGAELFVTLYKNGSPVRRGVQSQAGVDYPPCGSSLVVEEPVIAGDYFEAYVYQYFPSAPASATGETGGGAKQFTWWQARRMS